MQKIKRKRGFIRICRSIIFIMIKLCHKEEAKTMINIRPVSDLRNNFTEIESIVKQGDPVYLTKNG